MKNEISKILNLIESGNTNSALQEAKKFYNANDKNLDATKLLAYSYIQIGSFDKVIDVLESGFKKKLDKQDFDYFNNMGYALSQIEEYEKSIIYLKRANELDDNPSVKICLAEVFLKKREFNKAKEMIYLALDNVKSMGARSYNKYANLFLLISEINGALKKDNETITLFKQILDENFNENIFFLLTNIEPDNIGKEIVDKAQKYLMKNETSYKDKFERFNYVTPLNFGLAMYYQSKDKGKSEKYFDNGNKEIFSNTRYNSHQYQERIVKTMDLYKRKYETFDENERSHGEKNFFIVGSPRSGTTLLESIITANNEVFSGGELKSGKDIIEKNILSKEQSISDLSHRFISKYIRRTSYLRGDYKYIVDKMPENFLYLGFIQKLLPKSKIIRIYRNPWDTATSLYKQRYVLNVPYSVSFFNIGVFLANFEAINIFWDKNIKNNEFILDIKYENLVSDNSTHQKKIYDYLGINAKYSEKARNDFFSPTASIRQVRDGIHQKSIEKNEFSHHKSEFFDALLMQREYWVNREIVPKDNDFFGYSLDY